jgi:hypothetical protein
MRGCAKLVCRQGYVGSVCLYLSSGLSRPPAPQMLHIKRVHPQTLCAPFHCALRSPFKQHAMHACYCIGQSALSCDSLPPSSLPAILFLPLCWSLLLCFACSCLIEGQHGQVKALRTLLLSHGIEVCTEGLGYSYTAAHSLKQVQASVQPHTTRSAVSKGPQKAACTLPYTTGLVTSPPCCHIPHDPCTNGLMCAGHHLVLHNCGTTRG